MKRKILCLLLFCSIAVTAQDVDCNQKVWPPRKHTHTYIPQSVCIPEGMFNYITYVYDGIDINGDGLEDFICDWNLKPLHDGDTLYLSVFFQNPDSTFSHFKTLTNLYPIYFESYSDSYVPEDTSLLALHKKYGDFTPKKDLTIEKDAIIITMYLDADADLRVTYKFDKTINNWKYVKCEEVWLDESRPSLHDMPGAFGPTIDDFTYIYWEKEER
jgi:hypothetical protein